MGIILGNPGSGSGGAGGGGITFADLASPPGGTALGTISPFAGYSSLAMGIASLDPYDPVPFDFAAAVVAISDTESTAPAVSTYGSVFNFTLNPSGNMTHSYTGVQTAISTPASNSSNFVNNVANSAVAIHNGSGGISQLYGYTADVENNGSGNVAVAWAFDAGIYGAGFNTAYNFYAHDLDGVATNGYYAWFNSRGVRRVKEDNTFDSVGQAIEALYNPQFTKYTAGAANYERVILGQWNGNVAEIGTAAGGTGTLRTLRLIGNALNVVPAATFSSTVTATDFIVGNGNAFKTDTTTAHTGLLQAYDVDGTAYKTFATLTNGNTPDLTIAPPSGGTVTVQATTYKSSDGSSGATGSGTVISAITVKNGLITSITVA